MRPDEQIHARGADMRRTSVGGSPGKWPSPARGALSHGAHVVLELLFASSTMSVFPVGVPALARSGTRTKP